MNKTNKDNKDIINLAKNPNYVVVGKFGSLHGVRGQIKLNAFTAPMSGIFDYSELYLSNGSLITISFIGQVKNQYIVNIKGISDRTSAESFVNHELFLSKESLSGDLDEDEFYYADLIGINAVDDNGNLLGKVTGVFNFGAGDILEYKTETGELEMISFSKDTIGKVDLTAGRIELFLPTYLEDGKDNA